MIKVSIIVPVFNCDQYLDKCISSILLQTYKNIELVLVDDGSTDLSLAVCNRYLNDGRVQVISNEHMGLVATRKSGILQITGEYVLYIDCDDWIDFDYVERLVALVDKFDADVIIPSHYRIFQSQKEKIDNRIKPGLYDSDSSLSYLRERMIAIDDLLDHGINTYSWAKLYRRDSCIHHQLAVPNQICMGEDAAFLYPVLADSARIVITDAAGYYYRQRQGSILKSSQNSQSELTLLFDLYEYLSTALKLIRPMDDYAKQIVSYIVATSIYRTGIFFGSRLAENNIFSLSSILRCANNVGVYSSGSFGQLIHAHIMHSFPEKLVGWYDKDYVESTMNDLPVSNPLSISDENIDLVLIATMSKHTFLSIKRYLISIGVESSAICYPSLSPQQVDGLFLALRSYVSDVRSIESC